MTDSIKLFISIEHVDATEGELDSLPFQVSQSINQDGAVLSSTPKPQWIFSKLKNSQFQVTPVFQNNKLACKGELIGYEISVNVPACVIGNNALVQVLVYWCCVFALEFLKSYLLEAGCSPRIVAQLDLEHSSIKEVALTYLLDCKDRAEANRYNSLIESYGEATLNSKHTGKTKKPITTYRSASQATVTITKYRAFEAKSYVKVGPVPRSFEDFPSAQVRDAVYRESSRKVRLEFNADEKWLLHHDAGSPLAWKNKTRASGLSNQAFEEIRSYLRVSEHLRSRRPKPEHIAKLPPAEQAILLDYFDSVDPRQHPLMAGKSVQYFSSIKRHIETALRIDITIPWVIHSKQISPDLPIWMQLPAEYRAPAELVDHCFVRKTAMAKLKQLRQINDSLAAGSSPSASSKKRLPQSAKPKSSKSMGARHGGDEADETSDISDLMG